MLLHPVRDDRVSAYQSWVYPRYPGGTRSFPIDFTLRDRDNIAKLGLEPNNCAQSLTARRVLQRQGGDYHAWA